MRLMKFSQTSLWLRTFQTLFLLRHPHTWGTGEGEHTHTAGWMFHPAPLCHDAKGPGTVSGKNIPENVPATG